MCPVCDSTTCPGQEDMELCPYAESLLVDDTPVCRLHSLEYCSDPTCITERGGSVLAAELAQAERLLGYE
jgi:hypothetical protein